MFFSHFILLMRRLSHILLQINKNIEQQMIAKLNISCHLKREGCTWVGLRRLYQEHASSCVFVLTPCEYCALKFSQKQMEEHVKDCNQVPIVCNSNGCEWKGERCNL